MRFSRRAIKASLRLLWTLLLVVFSAHHAAPNAPIWHGVGFDGAGFNGAGFNGAGLEAHASHQSHSSQLAFTAVHSDHHSHCELCFTSAFAPPASARSLPRVELVNPPGSSALVDLGFARDQRLPEAHAPPRT